MPDQNSAKNEQGKWTPRFLIAVGVLVASFGGVFILSAVLIVNSAEEAEMQRLVFTTVLPLIGTWVGTVLAFYFSRENFESARRWATSHGYVLN